ncbi:endoglucanase [Opitutaceae bacterium TAV1]|nr:endoglucanase [Opitutaceae bacterium TAV1]
MYKPHPFRRLVLVLAVALPLFAAAPAFAADAASESAPTVSSPSILPDGTFETLDSATGRPAGWPGGRAVSWETEPDPATGQQNRFLRITSGGPARMDSLYLPVTLPPGAGALEFSARARVTDLKKGPKSWNDARVIMNFKDATGKQIGSAPPVWFGANTEGWKTPVTRFLVPPGATTLDFQPTMFNAAAGTLDLDDVILRPIPRAPLEAELARNAPPPAPPREVSDPKKFPPEIRVQGNRLVSLRDGSEVWLQGVNVASMEWRANGENVLRSTLVAIEDWKASVIRIPVKEEYWYGRNETQSDGGKAYRELADAVITLAANRGAYVVIDLHRYRAPRPEHIEFWTDVATLYKNHPAVLFDLLNEAHGVSWDLWRNGGFVEEKKKPGEEDTFLTDAEKKYNKHGFESPGMQKMVETVRATGARNVIVAGGLDYAYDLSGIVNGYALTDTPDGNGIMYASHIYPWKRDWQGKMLDAAALHPILVGEVGADVKKMPFETDETFVPPGTWVPDMLGLIQKHRLNWTGWCFHPKAGPRMLADWKYTPTPFWGEPAKRALAGEKFELQRLR